MIHEVLRVGLLQCNCSLVGDEESGDAFVIDPGADIARIVALAAKHKLTIRQILVTHAHIDHIAGALALQELTHAPVFYNKDDLPLVAMMDVQAGWIGVATPDVRPPDASLDAGATFGVSALSGVVLHTPGHTPGSVCLYLPDHALLFAGDTLFAGSIGRTDLPGGDGPQLIRSIHHSLLPLPAETRVVPGHGPMTTIGDEIATNPFLQKR